VEQTLAPLPRPATAPNLVPAHEVAVAVPVDLGLRRLEREVGHSEGEVAEEGLTGMTVGVPAQAPEQVVGDRRRAVVAVLRRDRRQLLVVEEVVLRREVMVVVFEPIGFIPAIVQRATIEVPLA